MGTLLFFGIIGLLIFLGALIQLIAWGVVQVKLPIPAVVAYVGFLIIFALIFGARIFLGG